MNIVDELKQRTEHALAGMTDSPETFAGMVRPAQDPKFGDFQLNAAMPLGKSLGKNPREVATEIVEKIDLGEMFDTPEVAGPGFINIKLKDDWLLTQAEQAFNDDRLGVENEAELQHIVVDFSGPNVAKPMHVGHLRSSVIGDSICRILSFLGHRVTSDNHIGDWGTQFGMITYGYKHFRDEAAFAENAVGELARLYRLVNLLSDYLLQKTSLPKLKQDLETARSSLQAKEQTADANDKNAKKELKKLRTTVNNAESAIQSAQEKIDSVESDQALVDIANKHPEIAKNARMETAKLHQGNEENLTLWNQFLPVCLEAMQSVYDRLGITFDLTLGESYYQPMLADVVSDLESKGLAKESDGAKCVFIEGHDAPFIIQKADGAFTYATTDLATVQYRLQELKADAIYYVVDVRQGEHFQLLFETSKLWGYADVDFRHVSFGTVMGKDKKPYKTRSGDTVGLESLLDEAVTRARVIVNENDDRKTDADGKPTPELNDDERQRVAEIVGIGGIKYADLMHNRESDYVFDWDKMLATTGNTATYMQYAYARVAGVFRKCDTSPEAVRQSPQSINCDEPEERSLLLKLIRFQEALQSTAHECRPNLLTQYLYETAEAFSKFYDQCSVKNAPTEELRASRLKLCDFTARVIQKGLQLLGIHTADRM